MVMASPLDTFTLSTARLLVTSRPVSGAKYSSRSTVLFFIRYTVTPSGHDGLASSFFSLVYSRSMLILPSSATIHFTLAERPLLAGTM